MADPTSILLKIFSDPAIVSVLQGCGARLLIAFLQSAGKQVDANDAAEPYKPYLEKGLLVVTLSVTILKAILEGNAAGAPWDQVVNAVMFFIGAKGTGDQITKKLVTTVRVALVNRRT